jgi:hypothetical protein
VTSGFWLSYAALCSLQGLLVLTPFPARRRSSFPLPAALLPVALLLVGVLVVSAGGARGLADLATFGTPVAAGSAGFLLRWRRPWLSVVLAGLLYPVAWQADGLVADAAGVGLIAGACLSGAALLGRVAGRRELTIGLVLLVLVDVILVFATNQVTQTTSTLHAVPRVRIAGQTPLPALQDVTFGSALMGWLDFLAPALLGVLLTGCSRRRQAALAVACAGMAWGCLFLVTPVVPATVPVLAGLLVGRGQIRRSPRSDHLLAPS